jgi:hypothetical protein
MEIRGEYVYPKVDVKYAKVDYKGTGEATLIMEFFTELRLKYNGTYYLTNVRERFNELELNINEYEFQLECWKRFIHQVEKCKTFMQVEPSLVNNYGEPLFFKDENQMPTNETYKLI